MKFTTIHPFAQPANFPTASPISSLESIEVLTVDKCREGILTVIDLKKLQETLSLNANAQWTPILLSPNERNLFASFRLDKRRAEWLGGRIAAKVALQASQKKEQFPLIGWTEISILPDDDGRPVLEATLPTSSAISISHSHTYAAALTSTDPNCGLDIQQIVPQISRVQDKFTTPDELDQFTSSQTNQLVSLTIIWAAKEAVKKCILYNQPSLFQNIRITAAEPMGTDKDWTLTCSISSPPRLSTKVFVTHWHNYIIAYCSGVSDA